MRDVKSEGTDELEEKLDGKGTRHGACLPTVKFTEGEGWVGEDLKYERY